VLDHSILPQLTNARNWNLTRAANGLRITCRAAAG